MDSEPDGEPNEFDSLISLDENWSELYDEGPRRSRASLSEESDRKQEAMQNMASRPRSFHDDLIDQLSFFDCEPIVRELAEYIINNLDERGFLKLDLQDVVRDFNGRGDPSPGRGGAPAWSSGSTRLGLELATYANVFSCNSRPRSPVTRSFRS